MKRSASAAPRRGRDGPVDRAHHSERRHRIGRECPLVGFLDRSRDGDAARIRVLDDHARGQRELAEQQPRGGEVEQVDQRQLLAVQLLDARQEMHARTLFRVVGAALVRVLAVAEVESPW